MLMDVPRVVILLHQLGFRAFLVDGAIRVPVGGKFLIAIGVVPRTCIAFRFFAPIEAPGRDGQSGGRYAQTLA